MRLLLVEDDNELATRLKKSLGRAGYVVDIAADGIEAEFLGKEEPYDLIILDLGLPKKPGLQVLEAWRSAGNRVPVIILTARDSWQEKVDGLQAGADDYVAKPFHTEELLARISALLRRMAGRAEGSVQCAGLRLDEERQQVIDEEGYSHELTGTEFRLLRYFMLHPNKVLSKLRLSDHVYEYDDDRDSNVIEVYVNRLRRKLGKEHIETRRGQGYVFRDSQ
ncbi:response regulator transcription factor [Thiohalomonas denitrificans]|uniref:DNA-binding response regulator, OmpR family, contains REC and winged-helix (WHTH) domain n=1 Tax=Thiohalomonas denitrificans TaxID=415747 RepID=A0A1G5PK84_9GAMM|nr:response regulator transcription factor [Thiohalomonas denitrificans]SCZ49935.1 DNA-binding response regulator, OmpR family, contains REC and winged-helix (wHTH) domain [Thiohalomonas denitrificans]